MHLRDFENGKTTCILNVGCLTTGWDFPPVSKIFVAKPTLSRAKYSQMFGRGVRPLPGIVDRYHTPELRKAAIAESPKPHFEVFDLTDSSRFNDLQTAVDVLYPGEEVRLLQRVRNRIEKAGGAIDVDPILDEERAAAAREQAAIDALTEKMRLGLVAHGEFRNYERSVWAKAEEIDRERRRKERPWAVMPFGKYKGKKFAQIPSGYLQWVLANGNVRGPLRDAIVKSIEARTAVSR